MREIAFAVLLAATAAEARPNYQQLGLDAELVPVQCDSVVSGTRMGARLTVASCAARLKLEKVQIAPTVEVVESFNRAVAFADDLLDSVMIGGSPAEQVTAGRLKSEQYTALVARMRHACEQLSWHTTGAELDRARSQHDAVEHAIASWQKQIVDADATVLRVAHAHPELRADPVARIAIERVSPALALTASR